MKKYTVDLKEEERMKERERMKQEDAGTLFCIVVMFLGWLFDKKGENGNGEERYQ